MKNAALRSPRDIDMDRLFSNRLVPQMISTIEQAGKQRLNIWRGAPRKGDRRITADPRS
jgi:hypothetical protein